MLPLITSLIVLLDYFLYLVNDSSLELVIKVYPMANLIKLSLLYDLHSAKIDQLFLIDASLLVSYKHC